MTILLKNFDTNCITVPKNYTDWFETPKDIPDGFGERKFRFAIGFYIYYYFIYYKYVFIIITPQLLQNIFSVTAR